MGSKTSESLDISNILVGAVRIVRKKIFTGGKMGP